MLTDSTRSQGRRQSGLLSTVNQRTTPNGRTVTKGSGVATTQSENNVKVAENGSAITAPNEKPVLNKNTHDQVVVTMPTETNKDNTMTNGVQ